jgi:hypothetical protein
MKKFKTYEYKALGFSRNKEYCDKIIINLDEVLYVSLDIFNDIIEILFKNSVMKKLHCLDQDTAVKLNDNIISDLNILE